MSLGERIREADSFRLTLHTSSCSRVENAFASPFQPPPSGYEARYQIVFPYFGLFAYNVGRKQWLVDAARVLCITPGWEFTDDHPLPGVGHAAVLVTLATDLVHTIFGPRPWETSVCFEQATGPSNGRLQMLTHTLLRQGPQGHDPLATDERTIAALMDLRCGTRAQIRSSGTVRRAKEVLHAFGSERLSLDQIATLVGVTPVYLTQEFTRSERIPLYQYQLKLRLNRSLLALPQCENITELALDLGFSSHSQFTSVFRKAFGMTPSKSREDAGSKHADSESKIAAVWRFSNWRVAQQAHSLLSSAEIASPWPEACQRRALPPASPKL